MPKSRKKIVKIAALVMVIMMVLSLIVPFVSNAGGTTSISLSQRNPKVGDSFTATVTASHAAEMKISYDSRVITLIGTTVDGPQTSNSITVNAQSITLTFQAKAEGTSGVIVESAALTGSSVNVPVAAAQTAPAPEPAPTPALTPSQTQTNTNETDAAEGTEGDIPEEEIVLSGGRDISLVVETPSLLPSARLSASSLMINEKQVPAYVLSGASGEYYYIYGRDENSIYGWYLYDELSGDIFPADQSVLELVDSLDAKLSEGSTTQVTEESRDKKGFELPFELSPKLIMILAGAFVALMILILIVNAIAKAGSRPKRYDYDEDFEDDEEDEDDEDYDEEIVDNTKDVDVRQNEDAADLYADVDSNLYSSPEHQNNADAYGTEYTPVMPQMSEVPQTADTFGQVPNQYSFTYSPEADTVYAPDEYSKEAFSAPQYQLTPREELEPTREEVNNELIDDIIKNVNINEAMDDYDSDLEDLDDF